MSESRQQLRAKLRTLRDARTGEAHRKAAAMASEMDVDPMTMLDQLGLTPDEKAAVERAAATGSTGDVQRALLKTQAKALGLAEAGGQAAGKPELESEDEDEEAPPPLAPAAAEIVPRCERLAQRPVRRSRTGKSGKSGKSKKRSGRR